MGLRLVSALIVILLSASACGLDEIKSDIYDLHISNQTRETLLIFIDDVYDFQIDPGQEKIATIGKSLSWNVVAKNSQGKIVFSKEITKTEVISSNETRGKRYVYRVVITEVKERTGSNNVTSGK